MQAANAAGPLRHVLVRIRLFGCAVLGVATYLVLPPSFERATRLLIGWNLAATIFLILVGIMMARSTHESMRKRARELDEGRHMVLVLAVGAALSSLAAILFELFKLKSAPSDIAALHVGLSVATIITSWSFVHVIFTEHYAHGFYLARGDGEDDGGGDEGGPMTRGLHFPGQAWPDYLDFLYFSFTIGVANQTADVEILSRGMRFLVIVHSVISYFFNTIILALAINIAASMLGG